MACEFLVVVRHKLLLKSAIHCLLTYLLTYKQWQNARRQILNHCSVINVLYQNITISPLRCKKLAQCATEHWSCGAKMLHHARDNDTQSLRRHQLIKLWTLKETTENCNKLYNQQYTRLIINLLQPEGPRFYPGTCGKWEN